MASNHLQEFYWIYVFNSIYRKVTTQTSRLSQSVPEDEAAPAPKTWRMEKAVRKTQGHQVQITLQ